MSDAAELVDEADCRRPGQRPATAALLEYALRDASVAIDLVDGGRRIIWSNRMSDSLLGAPTAAEQASTDGSAGERGEWEFFDADGEPYDFLSTVDRCVECQERFGPALIGARRPDGSQLWADTEVIPVPACDGTDGWYAAVVSVDLTERRFAEQILHRLAFSDPLTGLANRVVLENRLAEALGRSERRQRSSQLFYLDLDRFKPINDRLGHEAGDAVLREVGARLGTVFRPGDTVARVAGDEFAVLVEEAADEGDLLERVRETIEAPMRVEVAGSTEAIAIGVSVGKASVDGADSVRRALHLADRAMYADKRRRRAER